MSGNFTDIVYGKMKKCIEAHCMLSDREAVIACVSGGCDSVALLCLLKKFIDEEGENRKLVCAHFDHKLRGEESDGDRLFTEELCKKLNVEFCCESQDVNAYCEKNKISLEAGARELRYNFFYRTAEKFGGKIAVAHNMNDRVETVLLNIARGTGIHGLKGISYKRDNIIRPLLDIERRELEKLLEENHMSFRTDSTNNESFCKRNKIRLDILPYLRDNLGHDIDSKLIRLSGLAACDNDFIVSQAEKYFTDTVKCNKGTVEIDYHKLKGVHRAVLSRLAIRVLGEFYPGGMGVTENAVDDLIKAMESSGAGYSGEAGKGLHVRVYHDRLVISDSLPENDSRKMGTISVINEAPDVSEIRKSGDTVAAFDLDLLEEYCEKKQISWEIRCREEGDYFTPLGSKGGKLLKKFFIDNKVPADLRNTLPLLVVGKEVLWIPGVRRSNVAPVGKNTGRTITFKFEK